MNNKVENAIAFALEKHKGQKRKDGSIYILHPIDVMMYANLVTDNEDILSACLLHDVVEDCNVDINEIREKFGEEVANIVNLDSEKKYDENGEKISWYDRKKETIENMKNSNNIGFKILVISDKLSNLKSIYRGLDNNEDLFLKFNEKDKDKQAWYYEEILNNSLELSNTLIYQELKRMYKLIFNIKELEDGKDNRIKG